MDGLVHIESRVTNGIAAAIGYLAVAVRGSGRRELPVNNRIPCRAGAEADLCHPEIAAWRRSRAKRAGSISDLAGAVVDRILQGHVEGGEVLGHGAGSHAAGLACADHL